MSGLYSGLFSGGSFSGNFASSPSPFLDLGSTKMPTNTKELYPIYEWFATMDNVINPIVHKISEYPIMPLDYSMVEDAKQKDRIKELYDDFLDIRTVMTMMALDYNVFGDSFASIYFPFIRKYQCKACNHVCFSDNVNSYEVKDGNIHFKCKECGDRNLPKLYEDKPVKTLSKTKIIKWRPHDIEIIENKFSGQNQYFYDPPSDIVKMVGSGNKFIIDGTPKFILEAIKKKQRIRFKDGEIFHMSRPSFSKLSNRGAWGVSLLSGSILQAYLKKVYSKASEVTGVLRSSPASVIYPETNTSAGSMGNPLAAVDISEFQSFMQLEMAKHRKDPGYVMTTPHPIGQQVLFGDSKAYNYYQEMKYQDQQTLEGMGVPREFLEGGLQFTGSSISLRILENQLFKQIKLSNMFLKWTFKRMSAKFNLGADCIKMKKFKMADDLNMLRLQLEAAAGGDLSKRRIWEGALDIDYEEEMKAIKVEDELKFDSLRSRSMYELKINIESQKLQRKFENAQLVRDELEQFKEQAKLYKKDPSYASLISEQAGTAQQQIEIKQMQWEEQQKALEAEGIKNENNDTDLKAMQQHRLAMKAGLIKEEGMQEKDFAEKEARLNKLIKVIVSGDTDPSLILDEILETSPNLYKKVAYSLIRKAGEIEDLGRAQIIIAHFKTNVNTILDGGVVNDQQ